MFSRQTPNGSRLNVYFMRWVLGTKSPEKELDRCWGQGWGKPLQFLPRRGGGEQGLFSSLPPLGKMGLPRNPCWDLEEKKMKKEKEGNAENASTDPLQSCKNWEISRGMVFPPIRNPSKCSILKFEPGKQVLALPLCCIFFWSLLFRHMRQFSLLPCNPIVPSDYIMS